MLDNLTFGTKIMERELLHFSGDIQIKGSVNSYIYKFFKE